MRETVGDGKILRNKRDPGLDGLKYFLSDWNLEDIASNPQFFLHRFRFRVDTDLHHQLNEGVNGEPGDRQFVQAAVQQRGNDRKGEWTDFVNTDDTYGRTIKTNSAEERRIAAQDQWIVPAYEGEIIINRQMTTFIFYNHLIEEILDLEAESRVERTPARKPTKPAEATANAMAKLRVDPKPLKVSISQLIAQAVEQKAALEDYLDVLRSEPVVLNRAINMIYYSRPELVPDERGRILP
jgi:hypothetical protein